MGLKYLRNDSGSGKVTSELSGDACSPQSGLNNNLFAPKVTFFQFEPNIVQKQVPSPGAPSVWI